MHDNLLDQVAWIGHNFTRQPVRGLVLRFAGLGGFPNMIGGPDAMELEWGDAGGLVVTPYHTPWAWMNPPTRAFVDELVDGILARYKLSIETPIISTGGSMGGHGALSYTMFSRHRVAGCMANCPVCDLPFHYTERPDLPRTMHFAYGSYGDITAALTENSPLHQAAKLPDVPYLIVHGDADTAVAKAKHSDPLIAAMRARKLNVTYVEVPGMGHCWPLPWPVWRRMIDFVKGLLR